MSRDEDSDMIEKKKQKGYTLIELMIVVAIIGILGAIAIPGYIGYRLRAERSVAWTDLQAIRLLEEQFYAENNAYTAAVWPPGFAPDPGSMYTYVVSNPGGTTTFLATASRNAVTGNDGNAPYTIDNNNNRAALGVGCLAGACW